MIIIDNDYMVNERGVDVRLRLKVKDNPSNMADIFLKQLSYRLYDYIIHNSINFTNHTQVDNYIIQTEYNIEHFKRALAEQAIYLFTNGDLSFITPDGGIAYEQWQAMRICPACTDILDMLGLLNRTVVLN